VNAKLAATLNVAPLSTDTYTDPAVPTATYDAGGGGANPAAAADDAVNDAAATSATDAVP
jgi:hypothetical protein